MTDRIRGFTVVLDVDYRDDDIESVKKAIGLFPGVIRVVPIVADHNTFIADSRALDQLRDKLTKVLWPRGEK